jgi:hypothetical protein
MGVLVRGLQVVGVLFAAFSGFLIGIAPPEEVDARFAVGFGSMASLVVLFLVTAVTGDRTPEERRRLWLPIAVLLFGFFLVVAFAYYDSRDDLLFAYPPESRGPREHVSGTVLTQRARNAIAEHPDLENLSPAQLVAKLGGLTHKEAVWTRASLQQARNRLLALYVALVICLSGAIFALIEVLARAPETGRS